MDLSTPLAGLRNADTSFESSAAAIVQAFNGTTVGGSSAASGQSDRVDLSTDVAGLLKSHLDFEANAKVANLEDGLTKSTFSILG
ncbi:MAG TPA: hypothetical protein VGL97_25620 [Bryobacteraceae bacterium]|jgi:hypothetical protein